MEIRKAKESDYKSIEEILFSSFLSKFKKLLGLSGKETYTFLQESGILSIPKNCIDYVAEEDGNIMGIMRLNILDKDFKNSLHIENGFQLFVILKQLGIIKTIKFLFGMMILSSKNHSGNCYIEHLAVGENARGEGIGTKLLIHGEKEAKRYNQNKYTLYVAGDNSAKELYEKLGFTIVSEENSSLTQYLFGYKSWLYMEKDLKLNVVKKIVFDSLWFLGFFGFVFFFRLENIIGFFTGTHGNYFVLLNFLWLLFFFYFIPQKK